MECFQLKYLNLCTVSNVYRACFPSNYLCATSVPWAVAAGMTGDWARVADTVATTAEGIAVEVVGGGRDCQKKSMYKIQILE